MMRTFALVSAFALSAVCACNAQAKSSSVETTYGSCSPNMSHNSGSIVINCKGLDPAVATEIAELIRKISQLNKTTATAKNQQLMIKVLSEIQATIANARANPQTVTGPIATGPCSNVQIGGSGNTSSASCGVLPRRLKDQQMTDLSTCLSTAKNGEVAISALLGDEESHAFAEQWLDVFKRANWTISNSRVADVLYGGGHWNGVLIRHEGTINNDGRSATYVPDSLGKVVEGCLVGMEFPGSGKEIPYPEFRPNHVELWIGANPVH